MSAFIYDGERRYLRADQVDAVTETYHTERTDAYARDPNKVTVFTRHVTMRSGKEFSSPGRAGDLVQQIEEALDDDGFVDMPNPIDPRTED